MPGRHTSLPGHRAWNVVEYEGRNDGQTAHYLLRRVMKDGDKGPWSETLSATIVG